ncbi:hypothetical protein [Nocardia sp. NPDC005745]|uniref:hypothetical protein n=1 Tax=Nocardia sp. NPDC005745 TaxID=3157061 RepID=UPI0033EF5E56
MTGLIVWIIYLATDKHALAWIAFILLIPVALLGFAMLLRWLLVYRAPTTTDTPEPAERHRSRSSPVTASSP